MTRIEKAVDDFFDDYGDIYDGLDDLQVIWLEGNGVLVAAPWPGNGVDEENELTVSFESNDYAGFIEAFSITGNVANAIKRITAEDLVRLYLKGKGSIDCCVGDNGHILWFQRMDSDKMLVTDVYDAEHEITCMLRRPGQFISYTREYYKIDRYVKEVSL